MNFSWTWVTLSTKVFLNWWDHKGKCSLKQRKIVGAFLNIPVSWKWNWSVRFLFCFLFFSLHLGNISSMLWCMVLCKINEFMGDCALALTMKAFLRKSIRSDWGGFGNEATPIHVESCLMCVCPSYFKLQVKVLFVCGCGLTAGLKNRLILGFNDSAVSTTFFGVYCLRDK